MGLFEKLQLLDESAKTKVLVVATAVAMIIVVALWYLYFNTIIIGSANQTTVATDQPAAQPSAGPGIWQDLAGLFMGIVHGLGNMIKAPRQYNIQPQ